jgi:hypothetical protein
MTMAMVVMTSISIQLMNLLSILDLYEQHSAFARREIIQSKQIL